MNSDDKIKGGIISDFSNYLKQHNLRQTRERAAIVEAIASYPKRISANDLHAQFEHSGFYISRATVYNTLDLLVDAGVVKRFVTDHDSPAMYERVSDSLPRLRLVCNECGSIKEVKDAEIISILTRRRFGKFQTSYFDLNVIGLCLKCQRRRNKLLKAKQK